MSHRAVLLSLALLAIGPRSPASAQLLSPGPLSHDHARLEGDDKCNQCHTSGRGVGNAQCIHCHAPVGARVRARTGLHGLQYADRNCGSCHVEHVGRGAAQVRWPGGRPERLDHRLTGYPLEGAHARVGCRDCHHGRSWLGARRACASCHREDPHGGRFGTSCEQCHNVSAWGSVRMERFDHSVTRFPLRGGHSGVQCERCHHTPPRWRGIAFGSCNDCHSDPHGGRYGARCVDCHTEEAWNDLGRVRRNHPGVSLGGGHGRVACGRCHDRGINAAPRRGARCVGCHQAVHEAPFGNNCARCHGSIRWLGLPSRIGLRAHADTPFPLRGRHEAVDCDRCHDPQRPRNERFRGLTFERCGACHDDRHDGEFARRSRGECGPCHSEEGFTPTLFGVALHRTVGFPLEGRHGSVACGACHRTPRPRLDLRVANHECLDCHENPHGEQFAAEMREGGCAHCHTPSGWHEPRVDHSTWPLTGAHARTACDSCHTPTDEDRRSGRGASYRGVPRECEGCHADAHAGQFRLTEPHRGCTDCHDTEAFEIDPFDHEDLTGYPLSGRHARVPCGACHAQTALRNGTVVTRYRLGYDQCSDCHANPHVTPGGGSPGRGR